MVNGEIVAIFEKKSTGDAMHYVHTDHLGSLNVLTNESGAIEQEMSFDPWGNRRDANTWQNLTTTPTGLITDRGFTGHEHLGAFKLINMNGRMYDPVLGRFLSPDIYVQAPNFTQSHNRFSYCLNNPLMLTDPTGYLSQAEWDEFVETCNELWGNGAPGPVASPSGGGGSGGPDPITGLYPVNDGGTTIYFPLPSGGAVENVTPPAVGPPDGLDNQPLAYQPLPNFSTGGHIELPTNLPGSSSGSVGKENNGGNNNDNTSHWGEIVAIINHAIEGFGTGMEKIQGTFRITNGLYNGSEFSPKFYSSGWLGGSMANITTYNVAKWGGRIFKGSIIISGALGAYNIYDGVQEDGGTFGLKAQVATGRTIGGIGGGIAGAEMGAAIGVWFGGFGAIPGAIIGGVIGGWLGSEAGEATALKIHE
jgi:RHS repeat-associated protein